VGSNDQGEEPDLVMGCCGDTPTLETLAAVSILREHFPELRIRVVNVVDLMRLQDESEHPHGLSHREYDALFTKDKPIVFAFHGYPSLVHRLVYRRCNKNIHVRGYKEEGTITTPFDMRVQNDIDRFHLVKLAIAHLPQLGNRGSYLVQHCNDKLVEHKQYISTYGQDLPEIRSWRWSEARIQAAEKSGRRLRPVCPMISPGQSAAEQPQGERTGNKKPAAGLQENTSLTPYLERCPGSFFFWIAHGCMKSMYSSTTVWPHQRLSCGGIYTVLRMEKKFFSIALS
jgi:hypothetical protein